MRPFKINEAMLAQMAPAERAAFLEELAALERRLEQNPLEGYYPHEKQRRLHSSSRRFKLFAGGNRSGKTTAGIGDDLIQALPDEWVPEHLRQYKRWQPPFYCRILAPDLTDTLEGVIFPKIQELCPPQALKGGRWSKAYSKSTRLLHFECGSYFQFMSFEMEAFKMGGARLHRVHFDEEPPYGVWRENAMRLIDFKGSEALFTFTPLLGMTWLYDELYLPAIQGEKDYVEVVEVDMDDNPHLDTDQKRMALEGATEEERAARKSGRFVAFGGLIYGTHFRETDAVIPEHDPPPGAEAYGSIDPGIQFMCGCLSAYVDHEGTLVVYDEIPFTAGETIPMQAQEILMRNKSYGVEPRYYTIDPASRMRNKETGRTDMLAYVEAGISPLALGQNDVSAGINEVKRRLEQGKLKVTANCTELIREFKRYRWREPSKRHDPDNDDRRSKPVKRDDHLLDALRYLCMSRPVTPDAVVEPDRRTLAERMIAEDIQRSARRSTLPTTDLGGIYA